MNYEKKNFQFNETVRVIDTGSPLDGIVGKISGISFIGWYDTFIISLEEKMETDSRVMPVFQTFTMPETYLERI